ncbi:MAG TPA: hypothetical protein VII06_42355 [Chloroflexota bacterium]|jgi:hypothetical protein
MAIDPSAVTGSAQSAWTARPRQVRPEVAQAVADKLGMSVQDLQTALQSGQHLRDLAQAKGVSMQDLHTTIEATRQQADGTAPTAGTGPGTPVYHRHHHHGGSHGASGAADVEQQLGQEMLSALADKLGESPTDLASQLSSGQDLGQLLQQKGLSADDVRSAVQQALQSFLPYGQTGATPASGGATDLQQVNTVA